MMDLADLAQSIAVLVIVTQAQFRGHVCKAYISQAPSVKTTARAGVAGKPDDVNLPLRRSRAGISSDLLFSSRVHDAELDVCAARSASMCFRAYEC